MEEEKTYDYDLFVIGAGSGGLRCAKTAAKLGAKVAVADYVVPSPAGTVWGIGGTCVNVGCVPKKLFHYAALLGESRKDLPHTGWKVDIKGEHDWTTMVDAVEKHIKQLRWNTKLVLTQNGIKNYNMLAKFVDDHTIELHDPKKDKKEKVTAKYILIAVGGRPNYPDEKEFPNGKELVITSDDIFYMKKNPGKSLLIGGSYIALETAGFLAGLGNDVTLWVREKILRSYDQEMAKKVGQYMELSGIKFVYGAEMEKIEKTENGKKKVSYKNKKDGSSGSDEFDTVFVAIGRTAETKYLNLEAAGVKSDEKTRKVLTNEYEQSNISHIYSVGDCAHERPELTPPAVQAGQLLAERLFGGSKEIMNYKMVATTFFTPLEYGCIGYGEQEAIEKFGKDNVISYHENFKPLEWSYNEERPKDMCYLKIVCQKNENEKVIGLHYLGPNAGEVVQGFSVAVNLGATKRDFARTVGIHPTAAEELLSANLTTDQDPAAQEGCKGCGL